MHLSAGYSQQVPLYVYDESHENGYLNNNRFHKLDSLAWRVMFIIYSNKEEGTLISLLFSAQLFSATVRLPVIT
jgi:hypothetical protein